MALLIVARTVTGAVTLTLLHSYLQGQVDDKLNAAVNKTLAKAEVKQKFEALGLTAFTGDAKTAVDTIAADTEKRKRVIELTGLKRE